MPDPLARTSESRESKRPHNNRRIRNTVILKGFQLQLVLLSQPWSIMSWRRKVSLHSRFCAGDELGRPRWSRDLRERQPGDAVHLCEAESFAFRADKRIHRNQEAEGMRERR